MPLTERFTSKIKVDEVTGCWLWVAYVDTKGYARFSVDRRGTRPAHRYAYQVVNGPVPAGLQLDHLCRVRHCVNPDHLEPVTCAENLRRGIRPPHYNHVKTHCPKGHAYDELNTYVNPRGGRHCRTCQRIRKGRQVA